MRALKNIIILQLTLFLLGCELTPFGYGQFEVSWEAPVERENGDKLLSYEIAGYELMYRPIGSSHYKTATIYDPDAKSTIIRSKELGQYEVKVAVFDINGLYSHYSAPIITTAQ